MRKSDEIKEKLIFTAAVICTVIASMLIIAVIILQNAYVIKLAAVVAVICFLLWEFHYSITHDSLGRKIKPYNKELLPKKPEPPKFRFIFSEDTISDKMGKIAERFKLEMEYSLTWMFYCLPNYHIKLSDKSSKNYFYITISGYIISINSSCLNFRAHNYYDFSYDFYLYDDSEESLKKKARMYTYSDDDFEHTIFSSDIFFDNLSDDEIFDIVEKIIETLYGARSMKYETIEADDGKEGFIFYLDAPDYYGYSETTEIGNFKFILNKENGGNQNG